MEIFFFSTVALTLVVSFCCSITEAALYSIPPAYVKHLAESNSRIGKILLGFKEDMGKPVTAILVLNTIANTAGPAVAGAAVVEIWGEKALAVFALAMTALVLFCGEITPKIAGLVYSKSVAMLAAYPLAAAIAVLKPMMWLSKAVSNAFKPPEDKPTVSHEEVLSLAAIGTEEGVLDHFEGSVITNVIGLDKMLVRDVLTPRVVVFRMREDLKLADIEKDLIEWSFTRIPVYGEEDPDHLTGYIIQRDVYRELMRGKKDTPLRDLARPLTVVPELMRVDKLLFQMFEKKEQICAVVDEHGGLAGIITLEDIIEEIVGREIVDEYDKVSSLRTFAGLLKVARGRMREKH